MGCLTRRAVVCALLCAGSLKAHDWQVIGEHIGEYLLVDILPDPQFAVWTGILKRTQTFAELKALRERIIRFLVLFELRVPSTEQLIVFHLVLHVVDDLLHWGPSKSTWMYGVERYATDWVQFSLPKAELLRSLLLSFNAIIGRMIHNLATPEVNMIGVFRMFTHAQYLPVEYQSSLSELLAKSEKGQAFASRYDTFAAAAGVAVPNKAVQLLATSRRGSLHLSDAEYSHVRSLARLAIPSYDALCSRFETLGLLGSKRALASSEDLAKWAMLEEQPAATVVLASGPPLTADRYFSAEVHRAKFGSAIREHKRAVCRSRNSNFGMSGSRLGKRELFGSCQEFLDCSFAGHQLVVARVHLSETLGREPRSGMHRVSSAQFLQGPRFELVLAAEISCSVAFAVQDAATKRWWVIDCSRV